MARQSTTRQSGMVADPPAAGDEAWDDWDGQDTGARRPRRPRAGSGGRWWIWVGRLVLWAFILVVIFNGIWLPFREGIAGPSEQESPTEETGTSFPETAAAAFALQFATTYLNPGDSDTDRADELATYLPEGQATSFNLTGEGSLAGEDIEVIGVDAVDDRYAVVMLTANVNGEIMRLDVPVYASEGGEALVVSGEPALLAAPETATLPEAPSVPADADARSQLEPVLRSFFDSYATPPESPDDPEHLSAYLESGVSLNPLPEDTLEFSSLGDVIVPEAESGGEDVRQVQATVEWQLHGTSDDPTTLTQTYLLTVVWDGSMWKVRDLQGAPHSFGS